MCGPPQSASVVTPVHKCGNYPCSILAGVEDDMYVYTEENLGPKELCGLVKSGHVLGPPPPHESSGDQAIIKIIMVVGDVHIGRKRTLAYGEL